MNLVKRMKVQHQYTLVQGFYWVAYCVLMGFAAVFLHYKGLSNTLIGVVVGGSAFVSIWVQPKLAELVEKVKWLSIKKMILIIMFIVSLIYLLIGIIPMPKTVLVLLYVILNTLYSSMIPLITSMGMEYMNQGYPVNYGVSRGVGSITYAVAAVVLGQLTERINAGVMTYVFIAVEVLMAVAVLSMHELEKRTSGTKQEESAGIWEILRKNSAIRLFAMGFAISYMANCISGTYLVNIVKNLGGTNATFGIAAFLSAASEMPAMFFCSYLVQRVSCRKLLKFSSFFYVVKLFMLYMASSIPMAFLGLLMQSLSFGIYTPASVYLINQELDVKDRVKGQTIFGIVTVGIGSCIGNLAGGYMLDMIGLKTSLGICVIFELAGFLISLQVDSHKS